MTARESTNQFWGLVQQKGPWTETAQDKINAANSRGYAGKYDRVARPFVQGFMPPAPPPTAYSTKSIILNPPKLAYDDISFLERQQQQQLLKTFAMDITKALYPKAGNFSRSGPVLEAYSQHNTIVNNQLNQQIVQNGMTYGDKPVQNPPLPVIHTEELDYVMESPSSGSPSSGSSYSPSSSSSMDLSPIPVFNGTEMYPSSSSSTSTSSFDAMVPFFNGGLHPMGPEPLPNKPPYPRDFVTKRPAIEYPLVGKRIKPNPPSSHLGKRKRSTNGTKNVKKSKPTPKEPKEEKKHYKIPKTKRSPPIKKKKMKPKTTKRKMVTEDIAPATDPAVRSSLKRKGDPLEMSGKAHINRDIRVRDNKRKADSHRAASGKKQKTKGKPNLKVRVTGLPDSKQSSTKKKGVRAENFSSANTQSNIPTRVLRKR